MSWCCFQQINTICSSLPFGVDEEEMKEFHGNGRDTAADHQVGKQRAIKKRQEKTVSLCPWKEGPSALLSNIYRVRNAARAQRGDVLKHSDTLHHSDLSSIIVGSLVLLAPRTKMSPPASTADLPPRACLFLAMDSVTKNIIFHQQGRTAGSRGTDFSPFS